MDKNMIVWEDKAVRIEIHESEIPWLKIFTQYPYREMSEAPSEIKTEIYELLDLIEKEMIVYFRPVKINIASFGNHLPHLHWHIMARFDSDSYFPEPMWGVRQREADLTLPSFELFVEQLKNRLATFMQH
jgi:diadenosine tetraphosphate (Ap4A) HIT family hydrolase